MLADDFEHPMSCVLYVVGQKTIVLTVDVERRIMKKIIVEEMTVDDSCKVSGVELIDARQLACDRNQTFHAFRYSFEQTIPDVGERDLIAADER